MRCGSEKRRGETLGESALTCRVSRCHRALAEGLERDASTGSGRFLRRSVGPGLGLKRLQGVSGITKVRMLRDDSPERGSVVALRLDQLGGAPRPQDGAPKSTVAPCSTARHAALSTSDCEKASERWRSHAAAALASLDDSATSTLVALAKLASVTHTCDAATAASGGDSPCASALNVAQNDAASAASFSLAASRARARLAAVAS